MHAEGTKIYKLADYIRIKELNQPYILPKEANDIIAYVSNMVGSPNYVKTPQFLLNNETERKKKRRNRNNNEINTEDWETIRNFQTTTKNEKHGFEKIMDDIKGEINKIADKNYECQKEIITEKLREVVLNCNDEEVHKIGVMIIEISSSNRFFSKLYSDLVIEIIRTYDFIIPIVNSKYDMFKKSIENFLTSFANTENDYELLCKINKENELRRSNALFFVYLMKNDCIEQLSVIEIIETVLNHIYDNLEEKKSAEINEELSELLFVILKDGFEAFGESEQLSNIYSKLEELSDMKNNDKGITNKTIFKIMDLLDIINTT
tara:strand:+ start:10811 stop:11773 length:963 start_codon:yes stop_codon:yes gene_type:complete